MDLSRIYLEKGGEKCHKERRDRLFGIILLTKLLMVWGGISYTGRTRRKLSSATSRANNYISDILGPKIPGFWQNTAPCGTSCRTTQDCTIWEHPPYRVTHHFPRFETHSKRLGMIKGQDVREETKNHPENGSDYFVIRTERSSKYRSKFDKFDVKAYSELFGWQMASNQVPDVVSFGFVFSPSGV